MTLAGCLTCFSARQICLLARHNSAWMTDVEEHQGNKHDCGVEDVLVCLMYDDRALVPIRVFHQPEDNADSDESEYGVDNVK